MNTNSTLIHWFVFAAVAVSFGCSNCAMAQYEADEESSYESRPGKGVLGKTGFAVEEFVPNRIKIDVDADDRRFSRENPLAVQVSGEEMFGQPITGSPVSVYVNWYAEPFAPDAWKDFTFGDTERKFEQREMPDLSQVLDDDGKTSITVEPPRAMPPAALRARIQVTVSEGGRAVTRSIKRIADPVPYYLGIKLSEGTFAEPGKETLFDVVAVKPDGDLAAVDSTLTGTVSLVKWNSNLVAEGGSYVFKTNRELVHVADTSVTLTAGRGAMSWEAKTVGNYLVRLADSSSSASVSDNFYASSGQWTYQPWSMEKPEAAELVLDKKNYRAGETARLLVKSPFPGTVLLTLEQDRVLTSSLFNMTGNTIEIPIPLDESLLPNAYAVAEIIRPVKPEAQWLPHRAVGKVNIPVASESRVLDIALATPEEVRPGDKLTVTADLRDSSTSAPVSGDIVVWAVDEGILTLTDFETPSPGDFFSAVRRLMVSTSDLYSSLMPDIIEAAAAASETGGGDGEMARLTPVATERVKPVILWQGPGKTGPDGKLTVEWVVPQYMGRLRVMAMAAEGKRFGSSDATVFVRNPIMVKEHLPRFAAPGDRFTAGFTVYNNSDAAVTPALAVAADGIITVSGEKSRTLESIPARDQLNVSSEMSVEDNGVGQANILLTASAGAESFATSVSLPVRPASPRVTEAGSLTLKAGEKQTVQLPGGNYMAGTTTITLMAGGRPDVQLAGALDFNLRYPYGCTEQVVSSVFPLLYLKDLARNMNPDQYSEAGIRAIVQAGIDRIFMSQVPSGGLSMWIGGYEEWNWASSYAAHFLVEAKKNGYHVQEDYLDSLLSSLQQGANSGAVPTGDEFTQQAYTCYVLARADRKVQQSMEKLYERRDRLSVEGKALLAAAYAECGLADEARQLLQIGTLADVDATSVTRQTGNILSSPIRETAMLLLTWTDLDPNSNETINLASRLSSMRHKDHWGTTQDNAFALVALGRYMQKTASSEPVKGSVTLGGKIHGFTSDAPISLSLADLAGADVQVHCESGLAHLAWVAQGVPVNPDPKPVSQGVEISRRYLDREGEPVEPDDIIQGEIVQVELTIGGNRNLDNVIIQDLLPAGLEIENTRLASSEDVETPEDAERGITVNRTDIRDDRMLVFGSLYPVKEGPQKFTYTTRAVTPGEFVAPSALLEVMYDPQVKASTAPGRIVIKPRQ